MKRLAAALLTSLLCAGIAVASGRSSYAHQKCVGCARTSKGRIKRSRSARREFQKSHPCPSTGATSGGCRGYVKDHIVPLKRGGKDSPDNMQWQTKSAAKAKDKTE